MSTHNIRFHREIRKNIDTFWLKKAPYQELCCNEPSHLDLHCLHKYLCWVCRNGGLIILNIGTLQLLTILVLIQLTFAISTSHISNNRLSRSENLVPA